MHRWSKRALLGVAALPLLETTSGCTDIINTIGAQVSSATFNLFVGSVQSVLLQNFPSADILQTLLGGNRTPFFPS